MTAPERLRAAVRVFRELGWADATPADAATLPLGTPEQRRVALAGLRSGPWGALGETAPGTYGYVPWVDVDRALLGLFAVRVGVDARRAVAVLPGPGTVPDEVLAEVLATRGPEFALQLVASACVPRLRMWTHDTTRFAGAVVRLVLAHDLPVPEHLDYLKDWSVYAAGALGVAGDDDLVPRDRGWIAGDRLAPRYAEHARAAVAAGVPATGPFAATLGPAAARGWIGRDEAVDLAFRALDAAQRPGDRAAWAGVLADRLGVTDDEVAARAVPLLPVLVQGDGPVLERLAPAVLARGDDASVVELLSGALLAAPARSRRLLLRAAARRTAPVLGADDPLLATLADLAADPSPAVAGDARALVEAWSLGAPAGPAAPVAPAARGLWQPTPALWTVPRFDPGPATVERLVDAVRTVLGRRDAVDPLDGEVLLALAVDLAHRDPDAARSALAALGTRTDRWTGGLAAWAGGREVPFLDTGPRTTAAAPVPGRTTGVCARLGDLPVLLSTPTWVDLRVDPGDLVERLRRLADLGLDVVEADLLLALLRTDRTLVTDEHRAALAGLPLPVRRQDGALLPVTAGPAVLAYLADPLPDPEPVVDRRRGWSAAPERVPASLAAFPDRCASPLDHDAVPGRPGPDSGAGAGGARAPLAVVRRATPCDPATAVNVLGALRDPDPRRAADAAVAARLAWERGLLLPGTADLRYLDRSPRPDRFAALATACRDLAEEGLCSVVWPVLDDLVADAAARTRLPAGLADVVAVVRDLLPEVPGSEPRALDLPGLRALAARAGASRAVTLARAVVAGLPAVAPSGASVPGAPASASAPASAPAASAPAASASPAPGPAAPVVDPAAWPPGAGSRPAVADDAHVTVRWVDPAGPGRMLAVDLTLPDGDRFRVVKGWMYDLEREGQCAATRWSGDTPPGRGAEEAWLRWSGGRLVAGPVRDWRGGTAGYLSGGPSGPLTTSMVAVLLASVCHDSADATSSVRSILAAGLVGRDAVRAVVPVLLAQPDVSPVRMMRLLTDDATLLPVLWPVLTESVRYAGAATGTSPRWLNGVLDVALGHAPLLRWAAESGRIPAEDAGWPGLAAIAGRGGSSAAVRKAGALRAALGLRPGPARAGSA